MPGPYDMARPSRSFRAGRDDRQVSRNQQAQGEILGQQQQMAETQNAEVQRVAKGFEEFRAIQNPQERSAWDKKYPSLAYEQRAKENTEAMSQLNSTIEKISQTSKLYSNVQTQADLSNVNKMMQQQGIQPTITSVDHLRSFRGQSPQLLDLQNTAVTSAKAAAANPHSAYLSKLAEIDRSKVARYTQEIQEAAELEALKAEHEQAEAAKAGVGTRAPAPVQQQAPQGKGTETIDWTSLGE